MKKAKRYAKGVIRRVGRVARKRYMPKGVPNLQNLIKDVKLLKHLVNVEKKRFDVTVASPLKVGQFDGSASGAHCSVVTPYPIEGIAQGQRIGLSLKLVSALFTINILQQANAINNLKIKWSIVCRPDNTAGISAATALATFYEQNPFSNVVDYYSNRDAEYFRSFRVIKSGTVNLHQDQVTSGQSKVQFQVPLKLNHHLKFNTDTSTITTQNQFYLIMVASDGDIQTSSQSGATFQYNIRWYYTDN